MKYDETEAVVEEEAVAVVVAAHGVDVVHVRLPNLRGYLAAAVAEQRRDPEIRLSTVTVADLLAAVTHGLTVVVEYLPVSASHP